MSELKGQAMLCFAGYQLDSRRRLLQRTDEQGLTSDIRLSSAEALILVELLSQAGEVCSKEQLLSVGWEGKPISPNSLTVAIANLRRYLVLDPMVVEIRSIPKKGYMLSLFVPLQERIPTVSEAEPKMESEMHLAVEAEEPDDAIPVAPPSVTELVPSHWPRIHKLLAMFTAALRYRLLIWGNLVILLLLVALMLLLRFEWLSVTCREQAGATVCIMDERHPFHPPLQAGQDAADSLYLVAGNSVASLSKKQLLAVSGDDNE